MGFFSVRILQIGSLGVLDLIVLGGYMSQSSGRLQVFIPGIWRPNCQPGIISRSYHQGAVQVLYHENDLSYVEFILVFLFLSGSNCLMTEIWL